MGYEVDSRAVEPATPVQLEDLAGGHRRIPKPAHDLEVRDPALDCVDVALVGRAHGYGAVTHRRIGGSMPRGLGPTRLMAALLVD